MAQATETNGFEDTRPQVQEGPFTKAHREYQARRGDGFPYENNPMRARPPAPAVAAALSVPDDDVAIPARAPTLSFMSQVAALEPGTSTSRCQVVPGALQVGDLGVMLPRMKERLRNNCAPAVAYAKKANPDYDYTVEVGEVTMPKSSMYVVAVVTCNRATI